MRIFKFARVCNYFFNTVNFKCCNDVVSDCYLLDWVGSGYVFMRAA